MPFLKYPYEIGGAVTETITFRDWSFIIEWWIWKVDNENKTHAFWVGYEIQTQRLGWILKK